MFSPRIANDALFLVFRLEIFAVGMLIACHLNESHVILKRVETEFAITDCALRNSVHQCPAEQFSDSDCGIIKTITVSLCT